VLVLAQDGRGADGRIYTRHVSQVDRCTPALGEERYPAELLHPAELVARQHHPDVVLTIRFGVASGDGSVQRGADRLPHLCDAQAEVAGPLTIELDRDLGTRFLG